MTVRDVLRQDVRFAIRQLVRSRSFAATAIATLAIGVGSTVAVFSVVDAVVLRPFPFRDADRVVNVHPAHDGAPQPISSNLEFATWRALPRTFDRVAALVPLNSFILTRGDAPEVLTGTRSTSALTEVFGVNPEVGRGFAPADDQPGAPHVVLLGHSLWMRDFNGARAIVGQSIRLDGVSYEVIGVMPASFEAVSSGSALWVPLTLSSTDLLDFKQRYLLVVARLAAGVTVSQAASAVDGAEQRLGAQYPSWGTGYTGQVTRYADDAIGPVRSRLFILLGAVSFVFLIACVNVANLLLARGSTRAREIGIRIALGAGRQRLVGQLLTESALLCVVAAAVGVALAFGLVHALVALSPPGVPRIGESHIDTRVLLVTLGVAAICTMLVGLFPAVRVARDAVLAALREGGRGSSEGRNRGRARNVLVTGEVALAMALLTGAGLLIRTAWEIGHVDPGFDSGHLLTAQILPPPARYTDLTAGVRAYRAIREGLLRTPGIEGAAVASSLPFQVPFRAGVGAEGRPFTDGERQFADLHIVSPDYFATMKMRLLEGRDFERTDNADAPNVAIINEALARKLWPGERAVGKRMEGMDPSHQHFMTIVGLIRDPRDAALDQLPHPEFYIPYEQTSPPLWASFQGSLAVVARTASDPTTMERALRGAVAAVDPSLPISQVSTMDQLLRGSRAEAHFNTMLLSVLAAVALLLASVGVYGLVAYAVAQRTREIGLRMALGATPPMIAALVVRQGLMPIGAGAVAGGALSVITTRLLREQLYGVAPGDPTTILAIAVLLVIVSLVAAGVPTHRAMSIAPVTALVS